MALEAPDSLLVISFPLRTQTFCLLARLNVSFELSHYLGKTAPRGSAPTQPHSLQQDGPHCHFLLSLPVYLTEKPKAEALKLVINYKNTS